MLIENNVVVEKFAPLDEAILNAIPDVLADGVVVGERKTDSGAYVVLDPIVIAPGVITTDAFDIPKASNPPPKV